MLKRHSQLWLKRLRVKFPPMIRVREIPTRGQLKLQKTPEESKTRKKEDVAEHYSRKGSTDQIDKLMTNINTLPWL